MLFLINTTEQNPGYKWSAPGNSVFETFETTFSSLLHSIIILTLPTSHLIGSRQRKTGVVHIPPGVAYSTVLKSSLELLIADKFKSIFFLQVKWHFRLHQHLEILLLGASPAQVHRLSRMNPSTRCLQSSPGDFPMQQDQKHQARITH